jgi:hypothetical protein
MFAFACPCSECVGGDFDLSASVADAVNKRKRCTTAKSGAEDGA